MCISATRPDESPIGSTPEHGLPEVVETNLADYWLALGSNARGRVHTDDAIRWSYSGGPFFNRVVLAHLDHENADDYIDNVVRSFKRLRAAITWLTGPTTTPHDLGERLQRFGFSRYDDWKGMAHRLDNLDDLPAVPPETTVRAVSDRESRRAWSRVIRSSFELPESACQILLESLDADPDERGYVWRHNLAYQEGVPVAASTLFIHRGIAGIYLVSTIPGARNQGLGTAMTCLALRQARDLGCGLAVLHATEAGKRIYEKLGFQHCCDIGVYRLAPPRPLWKRAANRVLTRLRDRRVSALSNGVVRNTGEDSSGLDTAIR